MNLLDLADFAILFALGGYVDWRACSWLWARCGGERWIKLFLSHQRLGAYRLAVLTFWANIPPSAITPHQAIMFVGISNYPVLLQYHAPADKRHSVVAISGVEDVPLLTPRESCYDHAGPLVVSEDFSNDGSTCVR